MGGYHILFGFMAIIFFLYGIDTGEKNLILLLWWIFSFQFIFLAGEYKYVFPIILSIIYVIYLMHWYVSRKLAEA